MKTKTHHNQKVADARSKKAWAKSLVLGRLRVQSHPTILRTKRINLPKTQGVMAKELGLSISSYCHIERGGRTVTHELATKIAKVVGSSIQHIFKGEGTRDRFRATK